MTFEQIQAAIRTKFKTLADSNALATAYDNNTFDPASKPLWCRLTIKPGQSEQMSIGAPGANRFRNPGVMFAQLFVPDGTGDKVILAMADIIANGFRSVAVTGITYMTPSITTVGRTEKWYQVNVTVPYYSDSI